ncbi:hypothetical protein AVEN_209087-1 [Araneus ventricosus]|uniref:Uncharacterized protein n=1 Tax=Araneus ventricosus TaxID=182803 RepID=A0A4Y2IHA9_ARAVE|nr:hypothetical protein AVEN_209087-1 [Araneus ventricosus]
MTWLLSAGEESLFLLLEKKTAWFPSYVDFYLPFNMAFFELVQVSLDVIKDGMRVFCCAENGSVVCEKIKLGSSCSWNIVDKNVVTERSGDGT